MDMSHALLKKKEQQLHGGRLSTVVDIITKDTDRRAILAFKHSANEYEKAAADINAAVDILEKSLAALISAEKSSTEKAKTLVARSKDMAIQLSDSLQKVNRILGTDFENRLIQLERMSNALNTLAELERMGRLQPIMKAIGQPL